MQYSELNSFNYNSEDEDNSDSSTTEIDEITEIDVFALSPKNNIDITSSEIVKNISKLINVNNHKSIIDTLSSFPNISVVSDVPNDDIVNNVRKMFNLKNNDVGYDADTEELNENDYFIDEDYSDYFVDKNFIKNNDGDIGYITDSLNNAVKNDTYENLRNDIINLCDTVREKFNDQTKMEKYVKKILHKIQLGHVIYEITNNEFRQKKYTFIDKVFSLILLLLDLLIVPSTGMWNSWKNINNEKLKEVVTVIQRVSHISNTNSDSNTQNINCHDGTPFIDKKFSKHPYGDKFLIEHDIADCFAHDRYDWFLTNISRLYVNASSQLGNEKLVDAYMCKLMSASKALDTFVLKSFIDFSDGKFGQVRNIHQVIDKLITYGAKKVNPKGEHVLDAHLPILKLKKLENESRIKSVIDLLR
jgi:hypothetical protein